MLTTAQIARNPATDTHMAIVRTLGLAGVELGFVRDEDGWRLIGVGINPVCEQCKGSGENRDISLPVLPSDKGAKKHPPCSKCAGKGHHTDPTPLLMDPASAPPDFEAMPLPAGHQLTEFLDSVYDQATGAPA